MDQFKPRYGFQTAWLTETDKAPEGWEVYASFPDEGGRSVRLRRWFTRGELQRLWFDHCLVCALFTVHLEASRWILWELDQQKPPLGSGLEGENLRNNVVGRASLF